MFKKYITVRSSLGLKLILTILITTVLSISIISVVAYRQSYNLLINHLGVRSLKIAQTGVQKIDTEAFKALKTIEDEQTEAYQNMRTSLSELRELTGVKYIYTMRKTDNNTFIYVVDGSSEEYLSHIGDTEEDTDYYNDIWNSDTYTSNTFEINEWGITLSSYASIKDSSGEVIGILGVDYDVETEYKQFQAFKLLVITVTFVLILIALLIGSLVSLSIIKPLKKLTQLMKQVEQGDLTVQASITTKDEIEDLAHSFNVMVQHINHLIQQIRQNSEISSILSKELSTSVKEVSSKTSSVNINVGQIADSMQQTSTSVQNVSTASYTIAETLRTLYNHATNSKETTSSMKTRASQMKNTAESSAQAAQETYKEKQTQILEAIDNSKVVAEIKEMADIISSVATQTHLLALNASIEAARAGEHGKGFMVVAEAVGNLAGQSSLAVKNIEQQVEQVQNTFKNLVEVSKEMLTFVDSRVIRDYKALIDTAIQYLEDIEFTDALIQDFTGYSNESLEAIHTVNNSIEYITAVVEETTAHLQEISSSVNHIYQSSDSMTSISEKQAESSQKLNDIVIDLFKSKEQ